MVRRNSEIKDLVYRNNSLTKKVFLTYFLLSTSTPLIVQIKNSLLKFRNEFDNSPIFQSCKNIDVKKKPINK